MADAEDQPPTPKLEAIGRREADPIKVEISATFLQHFSEFMYSSPQKAFEELISNSWDAAANCVEVRVPSNLQDPAAAICVLDNGVSMDSGGLRELWHIAFSPKRNRPVQQGRRVVGKFGIGKLATYVLAGKLTYICRAADGVIRRVTMDYSTLEPKSPGEPERLIRELPLDVFVADMKDVEQALVGVDGGRELLEQIKAGMKRAPAVEGALADEYRGDPSAPVTTRADTWTLVVLSDLKPIGRDLKLGHLRRMLSAALPFGSDLTVRINGEALSSSKINEETIKVWEIGPDLGIDHVLLNKDGEVFDESDGESAEEEAEAERVAVESPTSPRPHVVLPGIGKVTGTVYLFRNQITGGKSDERGSSNGFHVNVLGRVVNQADPSFGEKNLSHASWVRFRLAIRADGLNEFLTTNREQFRDLRELKIFRAFLRRVFNKVRRFYDSDAQLVLDDGGDALVRSLGVISLNPLRNLVSESLLKQPPLPGLFDETGIEDRETRRATWAETTKDDIRNALTQVRFERSDDSSFVKFRIADNSVVVNSEHPFVAEYSKSKSEKELVRTMAMVSLLSDVYALDIGIEPGLLGDVRAYRDKLMRFRALATRKSGTHIAQILLRAQHENEKSKQLEHAVSSALSYLGFEVQDLAKPGQPEGIARAFALPSNVDPPPPGLSPLYSVAFDAKSSSHRAAKTSNVNIAGVKRHRSKFKATYSLVVAPDFEKGALEAECAENEITPMRARDLGTLLELTARHGAIALQTIEAVFKLRDPDEVSSWVAGLGGELARTRLVTVDAFLRVLDALKGEIPDVLPAGTISRELRKIGTPASADQVIMLVRGLTVIIPDLIGINDDKVVVNASADKVRAAVAKQLESLHEDED